MRPSCPIGCKPYTCIPLLGKVTYLKVNRGVGYLLASLLEQAPLLPAGMGSGAISEPSADGVATDAAAGGSREPPGGSGRLVPSFGVASPLLLQLTQDQSWLPSIDLYEGPKYYVVVMDVRAPLLPPPTHTYTAPPPTHLPTHPPHPLHI